MKISESVILQFFKGECNAAEEQQVKLYLQQHPEILEQYMTEESWEATDSYQLPGDLSDKMRRHIAAGTYHQQPMRISYRWMAAAAAAVVLLLSGAWLWQQSTAGSTASLAQASAHQPALHTRANDTDSVMVILLEDHSTVQLEAHSRIAYYTPFRDRRRDIYLTGGALFTVAQDKTQPFTVHAGNTATTVLGTVFSVNSRAKAGIRVHLYSGKVVITPDTGTSPADSSTMALYLSPGQEAICNSNGYASLMKQPEPKSTNKHNAAPLPVMATMTFTDEPLTVIFNKLKQQQGVAITYRKADLVNMSFTGVYNPVKETVDEFLETLTLLNGLHTTKENNIYHITR